MARKEEAPVWSLVVWGVPSLLLMLYGVWGVYDGWFRPGYPYVDFSRYVATPGGFAAGLYCLWRAIREYRQIKSGAGKAGGSADDGKPPEGDEAGSSRGSD